MGSITCAEVYATKFYLLLLYSITNTHLQKRPEFLLVLTFFPLFLTPESYCLLDTIISSRAAAQLIRLVRLIAVSHHYDRTCSVKMPPRVQNEAP